MSRRTWGLVAAIMLVLAKPARAALQLTTDHQQLFFGLMELGETKELAQSGTFHNTITCSSDNGRAWHLKIHVLQPLSSGAEAIPADALQWELESTTGIGMTPTLRRYVPFTLSPELVYISGANEASGTAVQFRFKYALKIPDEQVSGAYHTTILFTLTEVL